MRAIVLSGGGSKGSYQLGVWKGLRKLHIKYDIVTGTSVGAINGVLMTQNTYHKAEKLWNKITFSTLFGDNVKEIKNKKDLYTLYGENIINNGGMDVSRLEDLVDSAINYKKFYNSKINYGLVTVNITNKKKSYIEKKEIPKEKLKDYVIASATCFPAFKTKEIDGNMYVDGGYYDNLPINFAKDLGATEIICVDLKAIGIKRWHNFDEKNITTITPNNELSHFLNFNNEAVKKNIKYGYNDTLKKYDKLEGKRYTFRKFNYKKVIAYNKEIFETILNKIINEKTNRVINTILKTLDIDKKFLLQHIMEDTAKTLNIDDTKIYFIDWLNFLIARKVIKEEINDTQKHIINLLKEANYKELKIYTITNPIELLRCIYMYILTEDYNVYF